MGRGRREAREGRGKEEGQSERRGKEEGQGNGEAKTIELTRGEEAHNLYSSV